MHSTVILACYLNLQTAIQSTFHFIFLRRALIFIIIEFQKFSKSRSMFQKIIFLALLIAMINAESFPYRPAIHLKNCTGKHGILNCKAECLSMKYKWGTCVMYPKSEFWYNLCSCFTKPLGAGLEIDNNYEDLLSN